ncbi:YwiC-like family protein [Cytobacillus sp. Hm23]
MKPLIPKQHGAWAMLLIPFLVGIFAGQPSMIHFPLFGGWLLLYLGTYPLLMFLKGKRREFYLKWTFIYMFPALICLVITLIINYKLFYFGIVMLPFFVVNVYFAKKNQERALLNDMSAITSFSIGGVASYYGGTGSIDFVAIGILLLSMFFFIGSTFYVKTMIREKKNSTYRWISWGYHLGIIVILFVSGYPWFIIAYIPSVVRAFYFYGKNVSVLKVGIWEIINAVYFFLVVVVLV